MSETEELKSKFEDLIDFVRNAAEILEQGTVIDVEELGLKAAQLCETVESSAPEVANEIKPIMGQLIESLDALAMDLEKQKKEETEE